MRHKAALGSDRVASRLSAASVAMCSAVDSATRVGDGHGEQDHSAKQGKDPVGVGVGAAKTQLPALLNGSVAPKQTVPDHGSVLDGSSLTDILPAKAAVKVAYSRNNLFARRTSRLNRAGMATVERQLHYLSGILSLLIGTADQLQVTAFGYDHPISVETCLVHGAFHTLNAALGLLRVDWKGFPFKGREVARRASMWPSFVLAAFATLVCGTEWTMAPSEALLHIQSTPMQGLAWLNLALLGYIAASSYVTGGEANPRSGLLYDSRLVNMFATAAPMVLVFGPEAARAIYMSSDQGFDAYTSLLAAYPSMAFMYRNNALSNVFVGNFFSFVSTTKHYELLTDDQIRAINFGFNALLTIGIHKTFWFDIGTGFPQMYCNVLVRQPLLSALGIAA